MCCNCSTNSEGMDRREFIRVSSAGIAAFGMSMAPISSAFATNDIPNWDPQKPILQTGEAINIQPVLMYHLSPRREQRSWRPWGGLHNEQDVNEEIQRITRELKHLEKSADFPLNISKVTTVTHAEEASKIREESTSDVMLVYAASGGSGTFENLVSRDRDNIVFLRHRTGPVYLWYEIVHNRFLREGSNEYDLEEFRNPGGVDFRDIVVDETDEILWRLQSLFALKNTRGKSIVTLGGPSGWCAPYAPEKAQERFGLVYKDVSYEEMEKRIQSARRNRKVMRTAEQAAEKYLQLPNVSLATDKQFVINAFVLSMLFKDLMKEHDSTAFTIRGCMSAIIPMAETTACLPLMLLNDEGYLAFCESDFNVIPSGILLHYISGKPVFLNDPTYPHKNIVTCAHCTGPSRMNGEDYETTTVLTHFESDYGAAPKVDMPIGKELTIIDPDSYQREWVGLKGKVVDNPFLDICRTQWDIEFEGDTDQLNAKTKGFHWMIAEGDYMKEVEYAVRKAGIEWITI